MKNLQLALLTGCLIALPALLFMAFIFLTGRGEYYFPSYILMGLVFCGASFLSGALVSYQSSPGLSRWTIVVYLFLGSAIAWFISLGVLAMLSLTPLCICQDKGDGNNNLTLCMLQIVIVSISYTPFMLLLVGLTSLVTGRLLSSSVDRSHL